MNTIYASFDNSNLAEKATGALMDYGVRSEDISLIAPQNPGVAVTDAAVDDEYNTVVVDRSEPAEREGLEAKVGLSTTTPADAASGAAKGAGLGLGVGILAGIASMAIPGVGLVAGGGALATAIAGAVGTTAAGAVAGGVTGYLKDQGLPEPATEIYSRSLYDGGAVLAVTVPSNEVSSLTVEDVLDKYGATNIGKY
jgi:hypothetical protein